MGILDNDITRLNFEDFLFIIFIVVISFNIYANQLQKDFIKTNNIEAEKKANDIYLFVLVITLFIYFYFLYRNYNAYKKASSEEKNIFTIKVLGTVFLISGALCLIYFQSHNPDFVGSPSI